MSPLTDDVLNFVCELACMLTGMCKQTPSSNGLFKPYTGIEHTNTYKHYLIFLEILQHVSL